MVCWLFLALTAVGIATPLQNWLTPHMANKTMESLQTLALTIGGAMIGATAIASSFVLFAMQVNVERLPYGLFHRFSSDVKLLSAFALSFVAAIAGAAFSLISNGGYAAILALLELGAVAGVLRLLLFAYRRSLHLVNPVQQLALIYRRADRDLQRIDRHIGWMLPRPQSRDADPEETIDSPRQAIFIASPQWDQLLRNSIGHAVSFARRAGEQSDLEISGTALTTVISLNRRYVQIKGRTFFANNILIDNPLVTDGTINGTLEALRRLQEIALSRKDEPQLEQIFKTYLALVRVYLQIDYGRGQSKTHALLAAGYLEQAVESIIPHQLTDTIMQGVKVLGDVAQSFLLAGRAEDGVGCVSKIAMFGMVGIAHEKHRPITLIAMEQLAALLFTLLRAQEQDVGFTARQLKDAINQLSTVFLNVPDSPLVSTHSTYLAPFFSSTSMTSFRAKLTDLVNALLETDDGVAATRIADHIAVWADGLYQPQKELLLLAAEKRSHFTFDMIHWIVGITELLMVTARAPHTGDYAKRELEKHATWLFSTLTWLPTDAETSAFVENLSLHSEVFEAALEAKRDGWPNIFEAAWKLSLKWAMTAGAHQTGWNTLERWLTALCALALYGEINQSERLKAELTARLAGPEAPLQELRDGVARRLREAAEEIREREYEVDLIRRILATNDRTATQTLLREIADILSPATANEPVQPTF